MTEPAYLKSDNKDYILVNKRTFLTTSWALTITNKQLSEKLKCTSLELSKTIAQEAGKSVARLDDSQVEDWLSELMES